MSSKKESPQQNQENEIPEIEKTDITVPDESLDAVDVPKAEKPFEIKGIWEKTDSQKTAEAGTADKSEKKSENSIISENEETEKATQTNKLRIIKNVSGLDKTYFKKRVRLFTVTGILACILAFLLLFNVNNIIVTGNKRYSDEEIKSLVINENSFNNTLLFCLVNKTVKIEDVPLLDSIDVTYINRDTIQLTANEKDTIGMYPVANKVCCIDQDGIVIEILNYEDSTDLNLPLIYNLCSSGTVGEKIETDDESVLNTLHAFMNSFERYGIMPQSIYIEDETSDEEAENIVKTYILYFGNIRVLAGQDEYLEEKMRRTSAILAKLEGMSGTLHLESYDEDTENIIFDTNDIVEQSVNEPISEIDSSGETVNGETA